MLSVLLTFVLQLLGFFPIQANQTWQDLALGAMMYGLLVIEHQGESGDAKATAELATEAEEATAAAHLAFGQ